jgi:CelD/BcsL family acetyltransferase involved in cellulose biosynthesis
MLHGRMDDASAAATSAAIVEIWRQLMKDNPTAVVEQHPDLLLRETATPSASNPVHLLRLTRREGGTTPLAVLAKKRVRLPLITGLPKLNLDGLRLVGNGVIGAESPDLIREFVEQIVAILDDRKNKYDCLLIEDVDTESPLWTQARTSSNVRAVVLVAPQARWRLRFEGPADSYWNRFSSKTRYNFRRQKRLLGGEAECIRNESQVAPFLEAAAAVSSQSWQGRRIGQRIARNEKWQSHFEQLARLGALRCYLLRAKDQPAAFAIGTQWNGRFILEEIGYDTTFADFSPGTVLMLHMLEDMLQNDSPQVLDFGFGDGAYKQLFGNWQSQSGDLLLLSRRLRIRPRIAVALNRTCTRLERTVRAGLERSGLSRWARKLYRR